MPYLLTPGLGQRHAPVLMPVVTFQGIREAGPSNSVGWARRDRGARGGDARAHRQRRATMRSPTTPGRRRVPACVRSERDRCYRPDTLLIRGVAPACLDGQVPPLHAHLDGV